MLESIQKDKLLEELEKALMIDEFSVFVGAGLSKGVGHYDWKGLLKKPAEDLNLDIEKESDLVSIAQYYCNSVGRSEINKLIRETFPKNLKTNDNYKLLAKLPIHNYWTTNYDKLLESALTDAGRDNLVILKDKNLHLQSKYYDAVVYKMHGDIDEPDKAVLTREDYEKYGITDRKLFKEVLEGQLITNTFLFLGFSFTDPNFNFILGKLNALSQNNTRAHYCLVKRVVESDFNKGTEVENKEQYNYARTKQRLIIEDLKQRYRIKTYLMDSYEEITEILQTLYNKYRKRKIFISGSADEYCGFEKSDAIKFIKKLSFQLVKEGYHIVNGYGKGIGQYVVSGVAEYCYSENKKVSDCLTLMPFPLEANEDVKEMWEDYRTEMISKSGIALIMFGNKKDSNNNLKVAEGVIREAEIAHDKGLDIITLDYTEGAAEEVGRKEDWDVQRIIDKGGIEDAIKDIIIKINSLNGRKR